MSTENITAFFAKAESDATLADKVSQATVAAFVSVAQQEGLPFTAEEFLNFQVSELSDETLARVDGGLDIGDFVSKFLDNFHKSPYRLPSLLK
jgi:predicted ribosomally synthesized peptide with nif11-like leader